MRGIVWIVLLFAVAVVAASTLGRNDGLVSIYFGQWRTDLSLNLFVVLVLLACATLLVAFRSISGLLSLPRRSRAWRQLRQERAAQAALRDALSEYFAARYSRAHRAAQKALAAQDGSELIETDSDFRALGHLLAAASLHGMHDHSQRDEQLRRLKALQRPGAPLRPVDEGARLLAVEWAIDDRDAQRAIALLRELPAGVARRTQALRLRLLAQRLTRQPLEALATARLLIKHQAYSPIAARGLLRSLALEAVDTARDADTLRSVWRQLDAADRGDPRVSAAAAVAAAAFGACDESREWLRPFWQRIEELEPDERQSVALALMDASIGIGSDWLGELERAQERCPNDPAVAAAVGSALVERQLWGKARRPLEQAASAGSLSTHARRRAWRLLAHLADQENDSTRAQQCERAAANID
jgi:HemY protein